jgi:hypothetical protein
MEQKIIIFEQKNAELNKNIRHCQQNLASHGKITFCAFLMEK